jgi:hypothetical protein
MNRFTHLTAHSILATLALFALGCPKSPDPKPDAPATDDHAHPSEGPHHGQLIELGDEEYHAELTHDHDSGKVTVYLLDSTAKKSVTSDAKDLTINLVVEGKPAQFKLPAIPQEDDPSGQSSRFELTDAILADGLDLPKATARLNVTIGETALTGDIATGKHGGHDHEHGDKH